MKSKYLIIITLIFIISCEKEIKFNGDEIKTKIVLNGILMPDSVVKINLTESRFFLDGESGSYSNNGSFKRIDNATVDLWKDEKIIEKLHNIGEGYYIGSYVPQIGDNIRITASHESFDNIECSTEIVAPTPVISADTINYREEKHYGGYYNEDGNYSIDSSSYYLAISFDMFITLKDPKNIPNYYNINLDLKYYFSNGTEITSQVIYNSDDLVFQKGNEMNFFDDDNYLNSTVFNDELFDGKEYKLKIKSNNMSGILVENNQYNPDYETNELVGMEISIELQSLSYPYYMYMKTIDAKSNLYGFMEIFAEPVQIYTNIKGGIGILGSYSSSFYTIPLK